MVGRDEQVGRRDRVSVVHASILARERDEARGLAKAVLELGSDLRDQFCRNTGGLSMISLIARISCACSAVTASP